MKPPSVTISENIAGRNRTIELPRVTGLANDNEALAVDFLGDAGCLALEFQVPGFKLRALVFEAFHIGWRGPECLASRQKEIAGEAVLDGDDVAHLAELADPFEQNDFHVQVS